MDQHCYPVSCSRALLKPGGPRASSLALKPSWASRGSLLFLAPRERVSLWFTQRFPKGWFQWSRHLGGATRSQGRTGNVNVTLQRRDTACRADRGSKLEVSRRTSWRPWAGERATQPQPSPEPRLARSPRRSLEAEGSLHSSSSAPTYLRHLLA